MARNLTFSLLPALFIVLLLVCILVLLYICNLQRCSVKLASLCEVLTYFRISDRFPHVQGSCITQSSLCNMRLSHN